MARDFAAASTQYLQVEHEIVTDVPLTMACWFNVNAIATNETLLWHGKSDSTNISYALAVRGTDAGQVDFWRRYNSSIHTITTTNASANTWHHACGVARATNDISVFIDGGSEGTDTTDTVINSTWNRIGVGRACDSSPGDYLDGRVAEAATWNIALSNAEVSVLALGVSPLLVRPYNLVAYWPLLRDTDQDLIGRHDLTAYNAPTVATHPPIIRYPVPNFPILPGAGEPPPETAVSLLTLLGIG